jgi:hypothetical protein
MKIMLPVDEDDSDHDEVTEEEEEEALELEVEPGVDDDDIDAEGALLVQGGAEIEDVKEEDVAGSYEDPTASYTTRTIYVADENRITRDMMNINEMTEAISIRTALISNGSPCFTDVEGLTDPVDMAKRELMMRRFSFKIERPVGEKIDHENKEILKYFEIWDPNEMIFAVNWNV